jgi:hypothetical protein
MLLQKIISRKAIKIKIKGFRKALMKKVKFHSKKMKKKTNPIFKFATKI